jgi:hypothetical protein
MVSFRSIYKQFASSIIHPYLRPNLDLIVNHLVAEIHEMLATYEITEIDFFTMRIVGKYHNIRNRFNEILLSHVYPTPYTISQMFDDNDQYIFIRNIQGELLSEKLILLFLEKLNLPIRADLRRSRIFNAPPVR